MFSHFNVYQSNCNPVVDFNEKSLQPFDVIANRTLGAPSPLAAVNQTVNAFCRQLIAADGCFDWTLQCGAALGAQDLPFQYLKVRSSSRITRVNFSRTQEPTHFTVQLLELRPRRGSAWDNFRGHCFIRSHANLPAKVQYYAADAG
jgi:hypothetical protein